MLKFFLKSLLIYLLFISSLLAQTLEKIEVTGNKRISENTIIILSKINLDQAFDNDKLNNALKNLYETNFFSNIIFDLKENILKIDVTENPIIEDIKITGIKSSEFTEKMYELISLKNRKSFSINELNKDLVTIKNILKTSGYYFAKVDVSQIKNDELNSVKLTINIEQGKKAKIKKIKFIGDKKVKDKRLRDIIASEEDKFWKIISNNTNFTQNLINLDLRLLNNYYKSIGYYNVEINTNSAEINNDAVAPLSIDPTVQVPELFI